ncbi:MAG TPA: phosphopantetheine-binding protein [Nitrospirota bacterium]|nr:phosphopantetheine-binding protein [Nitrospirota bacterium]
MSTFERVKSLFQKNYDFPGELLKPEATIESIGLDSLDKIEFLFALEKEFNVKIPDRELTLNTIQDIVSVIERLPREHDGQCDRQGG